jgi:hypothetical protein
MAGLHLPRMTLTQGNNLIFYLKNKVAFKITIGHVIDQIVILKTISFFYEHLTDNLCTIRITLFSYLNS